ncbi:hypothetical protein K458DRAFT_415368 [Lentithecium fluviatile CBS 122367]|uniref:Brl1/Brr6 domain-containing protein n=1 Tax=Lentithecium fluviatile CBS 122367 TaxID=1168545 RepID=A0A6G1JAD4_9PLEO|nr:hypothetical protein K458DRAFT_415368 [Lentithecium fluviatile CBS 122367]
MSRHRESTTPMDFEYDNQIGRVDPNSPFVTAVNQPAKKRTHSVLDSPSKSAFQTPNRPHLREPNNQQFFFSPGKPLPSIPQHVQNSKAWEPRTPQSLVDFSSGGETPNTPAQDSDAATPDTQLASKMGTLSHRDDKKSPKKSKRESFFRMFTGSPSPAKEDSRKLYSKKVENRVIKRRSKKSKMAMRDEYDSDNGDDQSVSKDAHAQQPPPALGFIANIPGVLAWVESHPNLPAVLSYWMQLIVNASLGCLFLWLVRSAYVAVMNDINREAGIAAISIMHEITVCANEYKKNRCEPHMRVPALEQACNQWELCMKQDARQIARASVGARTFAMIFNAFVEEFSYKSMLFTAIILFGGFNLSNYAFGRFREKQSHPQHQQHHHDFYPPPPATPQRLPSGGFVDQSGWHTPYATPYGSMNQHMISQASQSLPALPSSVEDFESSPSKRGVFRR